MATQDESWNSGHLSCMAMRGIAFSIGLPLLEACHMQT